VLHFPGFVVVWVLPSSLLSFLPSSPPVWALLVSLQLWTWAVVSEWTAGYCDLCHDDEKVSLLECEFFDFFFVGGGLALEDDLLGFDGMALLVADLLLEVGDLHGRAGTVWLGSISTANTSPFRFFMLIFMIFQINTKHHR
jgi:hypothetical protein